MKRQTFIDSDGYYINDEIGRFRGEAIDRLAAYEDTGLEPEEIDGIKSLAVLGLMRDVKRASAIMDAEREGRLLALPCKVGDEVWVLEREDDGTPCDYSGYVFISAVENHAIISPFMGGSGNVNEILQSQVDAFSSDLLVVPMEDCYFTREAAEMALEKEDNK